MYNMWARISPITYTNPELGNINFDGNKWEAIPRFYFEETSKKFDTLKEATEWMESLNGRS